MTKRTSKRSAKTKVKAAGEVQALAGDPIQQVADCPKCGGTGIYEPAKMGGVIRIDCNECNATGRVLMTKSTGTEITEPNPVISE